MEQIIHSELMFFGHNDVIFPLNSTYNKHGLRWYHNKTIHKKRAYYKKNGNRDNVDNFGIIILLVTYDKIGLYDVSMQYLHLDQR